jgi:hypothetical protein
MISVHERDVACGPRTRACRGTSAAGRAQELAAVAALKDDASLKTLYVSNVNAASSIVAIATDSCG